MAEAGKPAYLYLTTRGRRTGLAREIEIWFIQRDGRYYVIAEHGERAQWVQNIRLDSRVEVRLGESHFAAFARVVDAGTESALVEVVQRLSVEKYGWGDGLVVEISEAGDAGGGRRGA
jgi:deazaflavin-dependent oxidoreductase (nitroreductase family)